VTPKPQRSLRREPTLDVRTTLDPEQVLEWTDFLWDRDLIHVREGVAKSTRRKSGNERFTPIHAALTAWLKPIARERKGRVINCSVRSFRKRLHKVFEKAEVPFIEEYIGAQGGGELGQLITFVRDADRNMHLVRALRHLDDNRVVVFAGGTGNPFFTTDTTAVLRAAEMGCDAVLKATNVDGVYTADPKLDPKAKRYDRLTHEEAFRRELKVMDATAFALARENRTPIIVFSILEPGAIEAVLSGAGRATIVSE